MLLGENEENQTLKVFLDSFSLTLYHYSLSESSLGIKLECQTQESQTKAKKTDKHRNFLRALDNIGENNGWDRTKGKRMQVLKKLTLSLSVLILIGYLTKGKNMNTYEIQAIDGTKIPFDKETNLMIPNNEAYREKRTNPDYLKIHSDYLLQARQILNSSPYASYSPKYLNAKFEGPQANLDYEKFLSWKNLYLQDPPKGSIAPWSKTEKAYYLSLQTKKERYIYLVQRSGLKCAMLDIPTEAIGNAKAFPEITEIVESNRGTLKSDLHSGEWGICAGILGDPIGFAEGTAIGSVRSGFKARATQSLYLYAQLTGHLKALHFRYDIGSFIRGGVGKRPFKASLLQPLVENPPIDEFGMIPFLDEIIGVEWIMDFNQFPYGKDPDGRIMSFLAEDLKLGIILDPRDPRATKESREEFRKHALELIKNDGLSYDVGDADEQNPQQVQLNADIGILEAKVMAITPPQGYINAPYYYFPEELKEIYEKGELDGKLDPRIPAIYRDNFPKDLREKIMEFGRKNGIKDKG